VESEWPECGIVFATENISRMANELANHDTPSMTETLQ
ncbi:hypothetical protein LEMLEM_LOCUS16467, partial [Lemmus lemmus]